MSTFVAFLHHMAAFALFAALAVESVLIRDKVTIDRARSLLAIDIGFGIAAGTVLAAGLLRVFYFEKGSSYYFHSAPFIAKLALFLVIGLLSIYPTTQFISWRKFVKHGSTPIIDDTKRRSIQAVIHCELAAAVLLILCAALTERGVGYFG